MTATSSFSLSWKERSKVKGELEGGKNHGCEISGLGIATAEELLHLTKTTDGSRIWRPTFINGEALQEYLLVILNLSLHVWTLTDFEDI